MITSVSSDEGLAALLKRRRLQLGLSRTRVAELSGVKPTTIEAWEQGRVGKPPIHDVLKLARALAIPTGQIEDAVLADECSPRAAPTGTGLATEEGPLLERAMTLLGWSVSDAAAALQTSPQRIEAVRRAEGELSALEMMSLITVVATVAHGGDAGGGADARELLAQLRRTRV